MDQTTSAAPTRSSKPRWQVFVLAAAFGYLALLAAMMALETSLVYFPTIYPHGNWAPPGLEFEDVYFQASDGTRLHGWYVPHDAPRAHILFAHGNGGNLTHRAGIVRLLHDRLQASVFIFDYRGYGRSQGSPSEAGIRDDAQSARRWLAERAGLPPEQVVLYGESLGGGVMVDLAAREGARALVLENSFSSLVAVAAYHYRWLPVGWLMRNRYDSLSKIANYHGPLLQGHGDRDSIVPIQLARQLFAKANEPKHWIEIQGGDHNDPPSEQWLLALEQFFSELPRK